MDRGSFSPRTRNTRPKSDIYSTFVIHNDDDDDDGETNHRRKTASAEAQEDPYATMKFKDNGHNDEDDDEDEDSFLPPLLKRLPKDFGGGASMDYDDDEDESGDFGTMIVKNDRSRQRDRSSSSVASPAGSTWRTGNSSQANALNDEDDDDGGGFSTFVMRSTVRNSERESASGTMVRRTSGNDGGGGGSTMERAIASMQGVGEFGKQRKGSGSSQNEAITTKVSMSSIPDSVIREDPTTKYELLNELGMC